MPDVSFNTSSDGVTTWFKSACRLLCALLILTTNLVNLFGQQPFFLHYTVKTGLPSNTIYYTFQDSDGFLWLGTDAGVCRYDGRNFVTFTPRDGLADNEIFQIRQDSQKRIWFLSFNGRISYYHNGIFHNASTDSFLSASDAHDIYSCWYEDSQRRIWLGTQHKGFYVIDTNGDTRHYSDIPGPVYNIWEDNKNTIALIGNSFYFFSGHYSHGYKQVYSPAIELGGDISKKMLVDTLSNVMYCPRYPRGLYKINYFARTVDTVLTDLPVMGICTIGEKKGVYYNKVFAWDEHQHPLSIQELASPGITSYVMKDKEGGFWISTLESGLFYSSSLELKHITTRDGLVNNEVQRLAHDQAGNVWALHEGGKRSFVTNMTDSVTKYPALFSDVNFHVGKFKIKGDTSWIVISALGLLRIYNEQKKLYFPGIGIKGFQMDNGLIWISGSSGLMRYRMADLDNKQFQSVSLKSGQLYNKRTFGFLAEPDRCRILFGTQQGLMQYANEKVEDLSHLHPFLKNRISGIEKDTHGNLWIVVEATGIVILNSQLKVIGVVDKTNGLEDGECKRLLINGNNRVLCITNHTLYSIVRSGRYFKLKIVLRIADEILNDLIINDNDIWLASTVGLILIPENRVHKEEVKTRFTDFYINSRNTNLTNEATIVTSYDNNNIKIGFTGISFCSRDDDYRYKIHTTDNWTYTSRNNLEFPSLSPGDYDFRIQSRNPDGSWSEDNATFHLRIEKPIWLQWWFVTAGFFLMVSVISFIAWRIYLGKHRKLIMKDKLIELELRALTAQMNPHFIFNTLNTIQRFYMTKNIVVANKLLSRFSTLIRRILDNTSKSYITIEDEILFLTNYLEVEQTRFNKKFSFEFHVDESIDAAITEIPSMVLQPFVENAIVHGLTPKDQPGRILICFGQQNNSLKITIDDDGIGRKHHMQQGHIPRGITLIKERLVILSEKNRTTFQLKIVDKTDGETGVRIELYL